MTDPIVPILTMEVARSLYGEKTRLITVRCPYCKRIHRHGWPFDGGPPGHRVADCTLRGGYYIEENVA